jgi:sec-independent protein translocase protein TatC
VVGGYVMFVLGVLLCYFLVFPFTFQFLGTYQVSGEVDNLISIESYMDTLIMLCLMMGIVFELPVVAWILSKMGLIDASFLRKYRRHAIVAILVVAAVITPTADVFTLCLVSLPIYLLYEVSVLIVRR